MSLRDGKILCDGWCEGKGEVTHIGEKGYAYCGPCASNRRGSGYERCRKLRKWELNLMREDKPIPSYEPKPRCYCTICRQMMMRDTGRYCIECGSGEALRDYDCALCLHHAQHTLREHNEALIRARAS